ncbi:MAG: DUF1648 domain-containing protein [Chitinophagaceae bacterium]|nr:DUF1648 domain-containing protein [Chitinophagaceae bacterium]
MNERPTLKLELTLIDKAIEVVGFIVLIAMWVWTILNFSRLPETIPIHYDSSGQVNNYGNKGMIFMLPIIATILFVSMKILNNFPQIHKYPVNITILNAKEQYTNSTRMVRFINVAMVIVFSAITFQTIQTSIGKTDGLGTLFLPLVSGLIFIPLLFFTFKSFRIKKS